MIAVAQWLGSGPNIYRCFTVFGLEIYISSVNCLPARADRRATPAHDNY